MARKSAAERLTDEAREHLRADVLRGVLSWRQLAEKYGIHEATLRGWADREGLVRNPSGLKRELVAAAMSKPDPDRPTGAAETTQAGQSTQFTQRVDTAPPTKAEVEAAAAEDARDMTVGLRSARAALVLVARRLSAANSQPDLYTPRDIKVLSESVAINIGTIRAIRGLDALLKPDDLRSLSEDDLQAIAQGKTPRRP